MWKTVKLGEICNIINGSTPLRNESKYWENGCVPWFTIEDLREQGKNITSTKQKVTQFAVSGKKVKLVPKNSVLLCCTASIGEVAIARVEMATNQQFNALTPKSDGLNADYLYYVATTLKQTLLGVSGSTTINFISISKLKELLIPLPPLAEQQRIVAKLDAAFAEIDRVIHINDRRINLSSNVHRQAMNDLLNRYVKESDYITIGDCIERALIAAPFDGNHGEIHPKSSDYVSSGVPFIMASDISEGSVDLKDCKFISKQQSLSLRKGFAKDGDILLTHKGTIGETAILRTDLDFVMLTPQVTAYRVMNHNRISPIFLHLQFMADYFQKQLRQIAGIGTTRAYIGITRQKELKVCLPNIQLQNKIVHLFSNLQPKVKNLEVHYKLINEKFSQLRASILTQALQPPQQ